jgi:serine/threonine protein kinase
MALADFSIVGPLGRTPLATVHRAIHRRGPVALKLLAPAAHAPALLAEARILDRLDHPCIPRVHERGAEYFVTDLLAGRTLAQVIADGARIDVACVLRDLSSILMHAQQRGVTLRGLSAERVTCVGDDRGVALCIPDWHDARRLTDAPADVAGSVHALGLIAFQILTGVMAHAPATLATLATSASVADYLPRTPARIAWLVDRMLARDPMDRPGLAEVHDQATRILATEPVVPKRPRIEMPLPADEPKRASLDTEEVTRIEMPLDTVEVTRIDIAFAG